MSTSSPSTWHTISPTTRPLSLTVLELTPLALTLSLTLASTPPQQASSSTSQPYSHSPHTSIHHSHSHHLHAQHQSRRKKRHTKRNNDSDEDTAVENDDNDSPLPGSWPLAADVRFKDLLSHGVVVSVNGQPWSRIVAHVSDEDPEDADSGEKPTDGDVDQDEEWEDEPAGQQDSVGAEESLMRRRPRRARFSLSAGIAAREAGLDIRRRSERERKDRAVVVVYGLNPGKEYEVELRVMGMFGEESDMIASNSVLIPPNSSGGTLLSRSRANSLRSRSTTRSRSNSLNTQIPEAPAPGWTTPPGNANDHATILAVPTAVLSPNDAQAAQLRHSIATAHAEKEHMQAQIKEARRASQRADAALRVEIETVRRAAEKAGSTDLRAKQKALALQEQVKQGWAGAEAADKAALHLESGMKGLERTLEELKVDLDSMRLEWTVVKNREEEVRSRDKKGRVEEERKFNDVMGRVDKLNAKKSRKEAEKLDLEKRLAELERQREEIERRGEEQKARRSSGYWHRNWDEHGALEGSRPLSNQPSLPNLPSHAGYGQGGNHRPRGPGTGYQPRFVSAGAVRPNSSQASPPLGNTFYHAQLPVPSGSPNYRPPAKTTGSLASAPPNRSSPSVGVNASAPPFQPSSIYEHHTTSLMPPQLQHRIYLPHVRPRPSPNFHPPPSVLAERQSPPTSSFPPLPGSVPTPTRSASSLSGPSLASIVTRAVLSPTSLLSAEVSGTPAASPTYARDSHGQTMLNRPQLHDTPATQGSPPEPGHPTQAQRVSFAPTPEKYDSARQLPRGPWSSLNPKNLALGGSEPVADFTLSQPATSVPMVSATKGSEDAGSPQGVDVVE